MNNLVRDLLKEAKAALSDNTPNRAKALDMVNKSIAVAVGMNNLVHDLLKEAKAALSENPPDYVKALDMVNRAITEEKVIANEIKKPDTWAWYTSSYSRSSYSRSNFFRELGSLDG